MKVHIEYYETRGCCIERFVYGLLFDLFLKKLGSGQIFENLTYIKNCHKLF